MAKFIVNKAVFTDKAKAIAAANRVFMKYGILIAVEEVADV